ncbi:MAG: FeoB-associated Cys-rich membrane protein [Lachnospiraceae bacterium]|nr:FeoB-associated Cys-rich membrane protein [Lachnospiraceae bacterium]
MEWIAENLSTLIVGLVLLAIVALIVFRMLKAKKQASASGAPACGCGGSCASCGCGCSFCNPGNSGAGDRSLGS